MRAQMQAQLDPEDLRRFAIQGAEDDFEEALGGRTPSSGILNVKSSGKSAGNHPCSAHKLVAHRSAAIPAHQASPNAVQICFSSRPAAFV